MDSLANKGAARNEYIADHLKYAAGHQKVENPRFIKEGDGPASWDVRGHALIEDGKGPLSGNSLKLGWDSGVSTTLQTKKGEEYALTFNFARSPESSRQSGRPEATRSALDIKINGISNFSISFDSDQEGGDEVAVNPRPSAPTWEKATIRFVAPSDNTILSFDRINETKSGVATNSNPMISNVSVYKASSPSSDGSTTAAYVGAGLAAVALTAGAAVYASKYLDGATGADGILGAASGVGSRESTVRTGLEATYNHLAGLGEHRDLDTYEGIKRQIKTFSSSTSPTYQSKYYETSIESFDRLKEGGFQVQTSRNLEEITPEAVNDGTFIGKIYQPGVVPTRRTVIKFDSQQSTAEFLHKFDGYLNSESGNELKGGITNVKGYFGSSDSIAGHDSVVVFHNEISGLPIHEEIANFVGSESSLRTVSSLPYYFEPTSYPGVGTSAQYGETSLTNYISGELATVFSEAETLEGFVESALLLFL